MYHGANLLPEGLETGEFKIDGTASFDELEPLCAIAYIGDEITLEETTYHNSGNVYNGILSGIMFIIGRDDIINSIILDINKQGLGENIISLFTIPKFACTIAINNNITKKDYVVLSGDYTQDALIKSFIPLPDSLDGYTPVNQKLRTYPYIYLGFNPPNGSQKIYRYENFQNKTPTFKMVSEININPTVEFVPQNYRGIEGDNVSDSCSLNGYPTLSYRTDYFNTWLAQNSSLVVLQNQQEKFNYQVNGIKTGLSGPSSILGNALSGDVGGTISGAVNTGIDLAVNDVNYEYYIQNQLAQIEKQQMLPDKGSIGSSNATLLGYNLMDNNIFNRYCIKSQYAKKIDKFFSMYGYLTNEVKLPNLNNRPNWNYVKTIGANIEADIPQNDLQILKNIFDSGVTLWHKKETFLDYSQNNR